MEYRGGNLYCTYTDNSIANASITGTSIVNDGTVRYYKTITIVGTKVGSTAITFYDSYGALISYIINVNAKSLSYEGHINVTQKIEYESIGEDSFYSTDDCCIVSPWLVSKTTSTVSVNGVSTTTVKCKYNLYINYVKPYEGTINILSANKGIVFTINANISDHLWSDKYSTIIEPTCTNEGEEAINCVICGIIKENTSRSLQKIAHTWSDEYEIIKPATCLEEGIKEYRCIYCEETKQEKIDITEEHDWDEGKVTKKPTLSETGIKTFTCRICGKTKDQEIPQYVIDVFVDILDPSRFFYDPVYWAFNNEITKGTSESTFSPDDGCTRAQFVTFLWRYYGCPEPTTTKNFSDVKEGKFYYKAVMWAAESGITTGYKGTDKFGVDDYCTREQCVTFIYRAAKEPDITEEDTKKYGFNDSKKGYYADAVIWAAKNEITNGVNKTTFGVGKLCTRGQLVTFLYRFANTEP